MAEGLPGPSGGADGVVQAPAGGGWTQIPVFSVSKPGGQPVLDRVLMGSRTCCCDRFASVIASLIR
jgi:hypothetical protein